MVSDSVKLVNRYGLHARAAAQFVATACTYKSDIYVSKAGDCRKADGKQPMDVLGINASKGDVICIAADGPDEEEALNALMNLAASGFRR